MNISIYYKMLENDRNIKVVITELLQCLLKVKGSMLLLFNLVLSQSVISDSGRTNSFAFYKCFKTAGYFPQVL